MGWNFEITAEDKQGIDQKLSGVRASEGLPFEVASMISMQVAKPPPQPEVAALPGHFRRVETIRRIFIESFGSVIVPEPAPQRAPTLDRLETAAEISAHITIKYIDVPKTVSEGQLSDGSADEEAAPRFA